jgi:hypothetical protein
LFGKVAAYEAVDASNKRTHCATIAERL